MVKLRYLSEKDAETIKNYKYSGCDLSITYKYFLAPLADFCLKFFPKWIAPNTITVSASILSLITVIICVIISPRADKVQSWWVNLIVACNFFFYQTLDNIDGRQARRTRTSSALGLLMDHGIDCLLSTVMIFSLSVVFVTGASWEMTLMWFLVNITFFWTLWEQYIIGDFRLPMINGPSEGLLGAALLSYFSVGFPGFLADPINESFLAPIANVFGHTLATIHFGTYVLLSLGVCMIITIAYTIYLVSKKNWHLSWTEYLSFFGICIPFHIVFFSHAFWQFMTLFYEFNDIPKRYPLAFIMLHGLTFCILIAKLMLAHMAGKSFPIWHWELVPLIIAFMFSIVPAPLEFTWIYQVLLWVPLTVISVIYIRFVYLVVDDMAIACNIWVFSVKPREGVPFFQEKKVEKEDIEMEVK